MVWKSTPGLLFADLVAGSGTALGTSGSNVAEVSGRRKKDPVRVDSDGWAGVGGEHCERPM